MNLKKMLLLMAGFVLVSFVIVVVSTFWLISRVSSGYEVADGRVYYRSFNNLTWKVERKEVTEADADSLKTIRRSGGLYAADKQNVFFEGISISKADPSTFEVLDWRGNYSRDAEHGYRASIPFSDDPKNLELLTRSYARDGQHVYFGSKAIEGADPESFVVDDEVSRKAHDKNYRYNMERRIDD